MFKQMETKVGLFIVSAFLAFLGLLGYTAVKKELFTPMYTYKLMSKTGENITEGMPVVFSGFTIGKVHSFELTQQGEVELVVKVLEKHTHWIRQNSIFILDKPLIGSPKIIIDTQTMDKPLLANGAIRSLVLKDGINEIIEKAQPVVDRLNSIMANVNYVTEQMVDDDGHFTRTLSHIDTATGKLATPGGLLVGLTGDKESVNSLNQTLKTTQQMVDKLDKRLFEKEGMMDQTHGSLIQIHTALKDVVGKLHKAENIVDNAVKISHDAGESTTDLKKLRKEIDITLHKLTDTIDEINAKLPLTKEKKVELP